MYVWNCPAWTGWSVSPWQLADAPSQAGPVGTEGKVNTCPASRSCMRGSGKGGRASKSTAQQQGGGVALRGHSFDRLPWVVVAPVPPSLKTRMSKTAEKMLKVAEGAPAPRNRKPKHWFPSGVTVCLHLCLCYTQKLLRRWLAAGVRRLLLRLGELSWEPGS